MSATLFRQPYLDGSQIKVRMRYRLSVKAFLVHLSLALLGLIIAVPLYWTVMSSLTTNDSLFTGAITWIPPALHVENYANAFQAAPFGRYFLNSAVVAVVVTAITLLTSALAGNRFFKHPFPRHTFLFARVPSPSPVHLTPLPCPLLL